MFNTIQITNAIGPPKQGWQKPQKSKKYVRGYWVFGGFLRVFGVFQRFLGFFLILNLKIKKSRKNI